MRLISALILAVLLSQNGCAARRQRQMEQVMRSFEGQKIAAATERWGPPSTVYEEGDRKVYVWNRQRSWTGSGYESNGRTYPGPTRHWNVYRLFYVDKDGIIVGSRFGTN